ncbi:MAG: PilZ domain-containing protein [Nitrospirae bacterium]|nr:PilZ domain-containing protein [Nitrospirota bacterium]
MKERRKSTRIPVYYPIRYAVTDLQTSYASVVEVAATIIDLSEQGFGIITEYPLRKGHVITIREGKKEGIPHYGMVKWSKRINNQVRAGLGFLKLSRTKH